MGQDGQPRPAGTYVALSKPTIQRIGRDEKRWKVSGNPAPDDVSIKIRGQRRCEMQIQCYSTAATGASTASAIVEQLVSSVEKRSQRKLLHDAGIGFSSFEIVQTVGLVSNVTRFEPRAITSMWFYLQSTVDDTEASIHTVETTGTVDEVLQSTKTVTGP